MGYLNRQSYLDKAQKGEKGEKGQGFALTPDRHIYLNNKRYLRNLSAPIDSHDATTKKFVTDLWHLLKTKSDKIYVDNEFAKKASQSNVNKALAALNNKVKKLEATVGELQKALKRFSE